MRQELPNKSERGSECMNSFLYHDYLQTDKKEDADASQNGDSKSPATEVSEDPAASSSSQSTEKDTDMVNGKDDDAEDDGVRNTLLLEKEDQNHKLCR